MTKEFGCWVYTTVPDMEVAKTIARAIVVGRHAACANILPNIQSIYWWDNELCEGQEVAVIFKTTNANYSALSEEIRRLHPYSCPCIVCIPWSEVEPNFMNWIKAETRIDSV